jgi:manganese-transporting P-type ATPase
MTKGDTHPNLRHRKHVEYAVQKEASYMEEILMKNEALSSIGNPHLDIHSQSSKPSSSSSSSSSCSLSQTDGYVLIPLTERSVLTRLDVGPFLIAYGALVFLDCYVPVDDMEQSWIPSLTLVAFPLFLLLHIGLILLQQWDVAWQASVGYQKVKPIRYIKPKTRDRQSSTDSNDKNVRFWTHCLVEAPHVDKHHASQDAGIVPIKQLRAVSNGSRDIVMIVNFQDIVFRCNLSNDLVDSDHFLWTSNGERSIVREEDISEDSYNGFHRLRYPIHYPLIFYKQWRGHTSMKQLLLAQQTYGSNTTNVELPPFIKLLQEQVLAPFFLFQLLCVLLWSLDEYWYYAMFTFVALLIFESTVAYNRLKSLERLRSHTMPTPRFMWVYRPTYPPGINGWEQISVVELVPGDLVSCKQINLVVPRHAYEESNLAQKQQQLNRVPADILILNGDAVVDESLLTGESVPQLKVPIEADGSANSAQPELDLQEHRQSVLFGGTTLVVGQSGNYPLAGLPDPPDEGLIGMVLRTGFETAQGTLLRTMAHTQKSVDGIHTRDTYVFILLLLCCAVASAALVWEEGWNDPTRNKFRLSLHVIIIITSVVPPELPMELSLAVTNSLADLMKRKIFCTEAFRIPLAGQVNFCCFDKTGTLTSDQMQLKGLRIALTDSKMGTNKEELAFSGVLEPEMPIPWPVSRIMVACHSLAVNSQTNSTSVFQGESALPLVGDPLEKAVLEATGYKMTKNSVLTKVSECSGPDGVVIRHRFGFSSRLKRMSVLATESGSDATWVLTKGAPETLKPFLLCNTVPRNYDEVSMSHMALGQRVLAIAYRELNPSEAIVPVSSLDRQSAESDLIFAGFLLLHSPIKHDSKSVVNELKASGHNVVMITGDAVLTAVEVSRQVGIIPKTGKGFPPTFQLKYAPSVCAKPEDHFLSNFKFVSLLNKSTTDQTLELALDPSGIAHLKRMVNLNEVALCISGDMLQQLVSVVVEQKKLTFETERQGKDEKQTLFHPDAQALLKDIVPLITVFARHAPRQKEAIIAALNLGGYKTLMCGDGTNDTMALRRSHVGISLISAPEVEVKQRKAVQSLSMAKAELKKGIKHKTKREPNKTTRTLLEESLRQLQEAQDELDLIDLGDASIASPFTSRVVNISCCKEVLKQGRCTLVTMLQIYKILGVNCLVNATILSKLFLYGVKQGDRQLTSLGLLIAALFFFVTRGKPLSKLSAVRPPTSVLCTQALMSISTQFIIHFATMTIATEVALSFVDPFDPSLIPDGPFNPNTLNTCTFLISVIATVNTFAVNYRGEPFVEPLRKNQMLWRSIQASYVLLFGCVFEVFPPLNDLFQLAEFPDVTDVDVIWTKQDSQSRQVLIPLTQGLTRAIRCVGFPVFMSVLMLLDTILSFLSEQAILKLFAST